MECRSRAGSHLWPHTRAAACLPVDSGTRQPEGRGTAHNHGTSQAAPRHNMHRHVKPRCHQQDHCSQSCCSDTSDALALHGQAWLPAIEIRMPSLLPPPSAAPPPLRLPSSLLLPPPPALLPPPPAALLPPPSASPPPSSPRRPPSLLPPPPSLRPRPPCSLRPLSQSSSLPPSPASRKRATSTLVLGW